MMKLARIILHVSLMVGVCQPEAVVVQTCHSNLCYFCTELRALCVTTDIEDVIPQNLSQSLQSLQVTFESKTGQMTAVTKTMLDRYTDLRSLVLSGDFSALEPDALQPLTKLATFNLKDSHITLLPDRLFAANPKLGELQLIGNRLEELPVTAFGEVKEPNLGRLYIMRNIAEIELPCVNGSLQFPVRLSHFKKLRWADFSDTKFSGKGCSAIDQHLFESMAHLTSLSLGGTNLLLGSQQIFQPLTHLKVLRMDALLPYKKCPALASEMLSSLPKRLAILQMNHWESSQQFNQSCYFTNESFAGLSGQDSLVTLSFDYSDQAFGPELTSDLMPPLPKLKNLLLSFCRITSIHRGAVEKYPILQRLTLDGNPIGSKDPALAQPLDQLKFLSLRNSNIRSDTNFAYKVGNLMCNYPHLEHLDMSSNLLKSMPIFHTTSQQCDATSLNSLVQFSADGNQLATFLTANGNRTENLCLTFPQLESLSLNQNRLRTLDGLQQCHHLKKLYAGRNHLGYGLAGDGTPSVFRSMSTLDTLDLSENNMREVSVNLLQGLPHLKRLIFQNNNLAALPDGFFQNNAELENIDLSWNFITAVKASDFSHMSNLMTLTLVGNLITSFPEDFLALVDGMTALQRFYIGNNPYDCNCGYAYFQRWANKTEKVYLADKEFLRCGSPPALKHHSVYTYKTDTFECNYKTLTIILCSVLGSFFVTVFIAVPCYKYRWYISHLRVVWRAFSESLETTKQEYSCDYDAYVSYDEQSDKDQQWVVDELIKNVEGSQYLPPIRLYVEGREAGGGESRIRTREVALMKSRKILIVASNSYLNSPSCLGEADIAGHQMHGVDVYQPNRVMVIMVEELGEEELIRPPMSTLLLGNVLQVESSERRKRIMWNKVRKFLAKPNYIYQKKRKRVTSSPATNSTRRPSETDASSFSMESDIERLLAD